MAHRIITQVVLTSSRILFRAVSEAYRQAAASQKYAAAAAAGTTSSSGSSTTSANTLASSGLTLDEACKILNVAPPKGGQTDMDTVYERFKRLYDLNEPKKEKDGGGGSFYLQSKILRARERIEMEVRKEQEASEREKEVQEGWKPKVYKDR